MISCYRTGYRFLLGSWPILRKFRYRSKRGFPSALSVSILEEKGQLRHYHVVHVALP